MSAKPGRCEVLGCLHGDYYMYIGASPVHAMSKLLELCRISGFKGTGACSDISAMGSTKISQLLASLLATVRSSGYARFYCISLFTHSAISCVQRLSGWFRELQSSHVNCNVNCNVNQVSFPSLQLALQIPSNNLHQVLQSKLVWIPQEQLGFYIH